MIKVEVDREKCKVHAEGNPLDITAELMATIDEVVNALGAKNKELKEFAKGFLIESIGEL